MAQWAAGAGDSGSRRQTVAIPFGARRVRLDDRACWIVLAGAMALSAALILRLNRATTYSIDQFDFVEDSPSLGLGDLLDPHNGHLVATTRLAYKLILETNGIGFLPFRLLGVIALLFAVGCFFALVKRWVGPLVALAPAILLLFFGSAWHHVVVPIGFTSLLSIGLGISALLALDRRSRAGDIAAATLATLSVATFSTGLAFLAGMAVAVLSRREDRAARAWTFLLPLALYAVWWLQAPVSSTGVEAEADLENALLIPSYVSQSLAAVLAAIGGLNYDFEDPAQGRLLAFGAVLALAAVAALGARLVRGRPPTAVWIALAIVLTFWSLLTLSVDPLIRPPGALRYMFMGAVGVLLLAAAAISGLRWSHRGLAVLFAVIAFSLATNVALLIDGAREYREDYSARAMAQFSALELARDTVDPAFDPRGAVPDAAPVSSPAGTYFTFVDRYGSPALAEPALDGEPEAVREAADQVLAAALDLRLEPSGAGTATGACQTVRAAAPGDPIRFELPGRGAGVRSSAGGAVTVGRFADRASAALGDLPAGMPADLALPGDRSERPWFALVTGASSVEVCELR